MANTKVKYSDDDMAALISEVENKFSEHLTKAETNKEQKNLKKSEEKVVELEKSEPQFDYDEEDISEMNKMYASMSKAEAEAHYKAVKGTLFKSEEKEVVVEKTEPKLAKSEEKDDLLKSELEAIKTKNEDLEKSNDELKKSFEKLVTALTKSVKKSAPKQKAITKMEYVAKSEEEKQDDKEDFSKLNKKEISNRLSEKVRTGSLKKSDKDAINSYYLERKTDIESIRHLL